MKRLIDHISKYITLTSDEYIDIAQQFQVIKIEKKCEFIQYGEMMNNHFFIIEGFVVSYIKGLKDYQHIYGFYPEDNWINNEFASTTDAASLYYYYTFEDTLMVTITTENLRKLMEKYPQLREYFFHVLAENNKKKEYRIVNQLISNAETKYQLFMNAFPEIANRMNLYFVASYLSIKPETLSRIRNMYKTKKEKYYL